MSTQPTPPVTASTNPAPAATPGTVNSMTGYAHQSADTPLGRLDIEIRAVNSRFTDLHFRLADECRLLEPRLRSAITATVRRGKVECRMSLQRPRPDSTDALNLERLAHYVELSRQIRLVDDSAQPPSVADYLRWMQTPEHASTAGDAASQTLDADTLWQHAEPLVQRCLQAFQASRAQEGAQLARILREQGSRMRALAGQLRPHLPELHAAAEARLLERLQKAVQDLPVSIPADETLARVRQEISLLSLKDDITEELDRLDTHLQAIDDALAAGSPVGKRLDFQMQELNREANTIASKSIALSITDTALALKLLIEQLREQVQNLE